MNQQALWIRELKKSGGVSEKNEHRKDYGNSYSPKSILTMVDRVFVLENGQIVADQTPEQLGVKKG